MNIEKGREIVKALSDLAKQHQGMDIILDYLDTTIDSDFQDIFEVAGRLLQNGIIFKNQFRTSA